MTIKEFAAKHGIRMVSHRIATRPGNDTWGENARHFRCAFYKGLEFMTFPFSQGGAHKESPTVADVLECLLSDCNSIENTRSFEEFAAEFGYDEDSRKAEKLYREILDERDKVALLMGEDYQEFLQCDIE